MANKIRFGLIQAVLALAVLSGCGGGGGGAALTGPAITAVSPPAGSTTSVISSIVVATFDVAMDPATINLATFTVTGPAGNVAGFVAYDVATMTATFTPAADLLSSTAYTATITTGAADTLGRPLLADFSWTFTASPRVLRVSLDRNGVGGNNDSGVVSPNDSGRLIAFESIATNLGPATTLGRRNIFLKDTTTGAVTLVSTNAAGVEANTDSLNPSISAAGDFVAFESQATNLGPATTVGRRNIFLKEIATGAVTLVSADAGGAEANTGSLNPSISAAGDFVAFDSQATNLGPATTVGRRNIFLKEIATGAVTLVSADAGGAEANTGSLNPSISAAGDFIAFESQATNLGPATTVGRRNIFLKEIATGAVALMSASAASTEGNNNSINPAFSGDGRYVAFESRASNLVVDDVQGFSDAFRVQNVLF